jgi:predicted ester cyclase
MPYIEEYPTMTLVDSGRATMDAYLQALVSGGDFAEFFAEDITIDIVGSGQTGQGRAMVEGMIRYFHEQAFDAHLELKAMIVRDRSAALEAEFVARHIGEFGGIPPTGRAVRVPYSVHYDLDNGRIKALRIYGLASDLLRALRPDHAEP